MVLEKSEENQEDKLEIWKKTKIEINKTIKQVLEIAKISDENLEKILKNTDSIKGLIEKIIKLDSLNIDLAEFLFKINSKKYINNFDKSIFQNSNILEIILKSDKNFYLKSDINKIINLKLQKDYSRNKKIWFLVLNNFVKSWTSILEVQNFIKNIAWENIEIQEELKQKYIIFLEKAWKVYQNDLKKNLFNIEDKEILNILFKSKFIDEKWWINKKILKKYNDEINKNFANNDDVDNSSIIIFLLQKIWLTKNQYNNEHNLKYLLDSLFKFLDIDKNISEIILKNEEDKIKKDKTEEENKTNLEKNNNLKNVNWKDEELLDFCNWNCSLYSYSSSYYEIDTWFNKTKVSKEDYKKFNSESLGNYLNFNQILYEAGLSFLFENKYKSGFIQLLKNRFLWFDYTKWQGFSEYHTLESLNIIAHLIWVPKKYYSWDWKLWRFDSIIGAMAVFNEINWTWKINNSKLSDPWAMFSCWASEKRMLNLWILWETGDFNVTKSENILSKWWYTEEEIEKNRGNRK